MDEYMNRNIVPRQAVELVKKWEGLMLDAYQDQAGVWTIGYGTTSATGVKVTKGMRITKEKAEELLERELEKLALQVMRKVSVDINDNELSALLSFAYNVGIGNFSKSSVLKRLNAGDRKGAADAFLMWNKITDPKTKRKVVSQGLMNRRHSERALFLAKPNGKISVSKPANGKKPATIGIGAAIAALVAAVAAFWERLFG